MRNFDDGSVPSARDTVYIFHVEDIDEDEDCHGVVTAIEYCYQYKKTEQQELKVFNWTVLILEDIGRKTFNITKIYGIESVNSTNCTRDSEFGQYTCCDRNTITDFEFPRCGFTFGVAEVPHKNNSSAKLLSFPDSFKDYTVETIVLDRARVDSFTIGSSVPTDNAIPRGLRMLWFVIGKLIDHALC